MTEIRYSIVVPCYKSGDWLEELVQRTTSAMQQYQPFELLLINDKSPDTVTWPEIERLAGQHKFVRGIDLLFNTGQFRAILCGIEHARGQFVITMDDDLQHPPEEIPKLIEAMHQNPSLDCIMGKYLSKRHSFLRNAGSLLMKGIMNRLYNKPSGIVTTSFRIMPQVFAKSLLLYRVASPQLGPLIVSLTKKIKNIPVEHHARVGGRSGYSLSRNIKETFRSIINASIAPLRLFSVLGFITAGLAFMVGLYYVLQWYFGGINVAGFTSLILAISFFSGMILAGIGVLGEYIGRIIQELTGMPRYQVRMIVGEVDE
ncbi:MAG: glycosyltransferase [Methylomicrobium sp.]|nr:glycosyltransferase [Methylomicrobium sp.]